MENITDFYCKQKITRNVRDDSVKKGYYVFSSNRGTGIVYYSPAEIAQRIAKTLLFRGTKGEFLVKGVRLYSTLMNFEDLGIDLIPEKKPFLYATREKVDIHAPLDANLDDMKSIQSELVKILSQSL